MKARVSFEYSLWPEKSRRNMLMLTCELEAEVGNERAEVGR